MINTHLPHARKTATRDDVILCGNLDEMCSIQYSFSLSLRLSVSGSFTHFAVTVSQII